MYSMVLYHLAHLHVVSFRTLSLTCSILSDYMQYLKGLTEQVYCIVYNVYKYCERAAITVTSYVDIKVKQKYTRFNPKLHQPTMRIRSSMSSL